MFERGLDGSGPIVYLRAWEVTPWWGGGKQRKHMRETYKASGKANSSTYITYEGMSKREVIKVIREQIEANRFTGNTVQWTVYRKSDGAAVAAGGMDSTGRRYRLREDYLNDLTGY